MARKPSRQHRREPKPRSERTGIPTSAGRRGAEFEPDYGYVIKDLRRIGLYAGICLAILLILSFIF